MDSLAKIANEIRKDVVHMLTEACSGHPGGSLSCTDILTTLYFSKLKHNPAQPADPERDYFILSKGHACPALYSTLAHAGYFPLTDLNTLRQLGSPLQGHPDMTKVPGIEASTGSLGQGLAIANGIALGLALDGKPNHVYALLGDGECQEGEVWEAAMLASHYKLDNLTAIVDRNYLQIDGNTEKVMAIDPIAEKWKAFGWYVLTIDGHDFKEISKALDARCKDKPVCIIAKTVKGKGVKFMENKAEWHGCAPSKEQCMQAIADLEEICK